MNRNNIHPPSLSQATSSQEIQQGPVVFVVRAFITINLVFSGLIIFSLLVDFIYHLDVCQFSSSSEIVIILIQLIQTYAFLLVPISLSMLFIAALRTRIDSRRNQSLAHNKNILLHSTVFFATSLFLALFMILRFEALCSTVYI